MQGRREMQNKNEEVMDSCKHQQIYAFSSFLFLCKQSMIARCYSQKKHTIHVPIAINIKCVLLERFWLLKKVIEISYSNFISFFCSKKKIAFPSVFEAL